MAVTGDIDLTLGLDFYRHKKEYKSSSLIPWARKAKEYIKSTVSNFNISYVNNSNNTISVRYNLSSSYTPEESISWDNFSNDNITFNMDINSIYPSINITSNISSSNFTNTISYDNSYYEINDNDKSFHLGDIRPEKKISYCSSKCLGCGKHTIGRYMGKCDYCKNIIDRYRRFPSSGFYNSKRYPWDTKPEKDYNGTIPWMIHRNIFSNIFINRFSDTKDRLRSIPWLKNMADRLYKYYVNELRNGELDNSEYLTDMSWIGVSEHSGRSINLMNESIIDDI